MVTIHIINYLGILDQQLEDYRRIKGYPESIKFPIKEDLDQLSDIDKVFALIDTGEFSQIKKAIEIVQEKQLFDLKGLKDLCNEGDKYNLVESLAMCFPSKGSYNLHESDLKKLPDEIALFQKRITGIWILRSKIEEISEAILSLEELEYINIENTPVRKIPYDWSHMKKLREIILEKTRVGVEEINKFRLPKGCKIEIIN